MNNQNFVNQDFIKIINEELYRYNDDFDFDIICEQEGIHATELITDEEFREKYQNNGENT